MPTKLQLSCAEISISQQKFALKNYRNQGAAAMRVSPHSKERKEGQKELGSLLNNNGRDNLVGLKKGRIEMDLRKPKEADMFDVQDRAGQNKKEQILSLNSGARRPLERFQAH